MNVIDKIAYKINEWIDLIKPIKNDWHIVKEKSSVNEHSRIDSYTGKKFDIRSVNKLVYIEQCRNTGKRRAKVVYGNGSLFSDTNIDVTKAELIIDGKL